MAVSYTFLQSANSTADSNAYTFSTQSLGTASADRYIIVSAIGRKAGATTTISSITVGGITATIVKQVANSPSNTNVVGLAIVAVTTGTTGDVVVTFADTMVRAAIGMWRVTGLSSATPFDTGSSVAAAPTYNLDVPTDGFAIGAGLTGQNTTTTWTELTEDFDAVAESVICYTGASKAYATNQVDKTMTMTFGANEESAGVFASWGNSVVADNIVSYWKLDESSGNATDSVGSNTLTNTNSTAFATGKVNNGADLESTSSNYFTIADASQIGLDFGTGDFTVNLWYKCESVVDGGGLFEKNEGAGVAQYWLRFQDGTGNVLKLATSDGANETAVETTTSGISAGNWYMITVIRSSTTHSITINAGTPVTATGTVRNADSTAAFYLGRGPGGAYLDGIVDEVGVWNRALSSTEVTALYNSGNGRQYPFLGDAYTLACAVGAYTLTGVSTIFQKAMRMLASAGSYTLTGIDIAFQRGYGIICSAGSYILSGLSIRFTGQGSWKWRNQTKNSATFTNQAKSSTSWTNQSKS